MHDRETFQVVQPGFFGLLSAALLLPAMAAAQDKPAGEGPPVAAIVNGDPIYVAEVENGFEAARQGRALAADRANQARAAILHEMIKRRVVTQALEEDGSLVKPEEIEKQLADFAAKAKQQSSSLEQLAQAKGISVDTLRKDVVFQLGFAHYLERHLQQAAQRYFFAHRKDLDGTELRVSHILLRPESSSDNVAQTTARAEKIREEIESGKISFADAAKKYSAGPSREQGGDLGFVPRRGVMVEPFAKAAFELEKGRVSQPVNTAFGTHLITVTDVKPGTGKITDVVDELKVLASRDLFEKLAEEKLPAAKIEFTGNTPHYKPGTEEVVAPTAATK